MTFSTHRYQMRPPGAEYKSDELLDQAIQLSAAMVCAADMAVCNPEWPNLSHITISLQPSAEGGWSMPNVTAIYVSKEGS